MEDVESRFTHFLQPIRDLTKNWEVDVAAQLSEYLEEVSDPLLHAAGGRSGAFAAELAGAQRALGFGCWSALF
uniref:Condensin-2 complex subunit H2 n=1 Tax=Varanus komodoensis TaxID=61221 RepID=A0A8D2LSV2_VARKO